jgi:hypothetical protein
VALNSDAPSATTCSPLVAVSATALAKRYPATRECANACLRDRGDLLRFEIGRSYLGAELSGIGQAKIDSRAWLGSTRFHP